MTREEAIAIIRKEYLCVDRDCDIERSCGKCDLMMPSKEPILQAYKLAIKALEQEPKTGHWIPIYQGDEIINYRCSECELGDTNGSINLYGWDYCRRCGAKMVEPQEKRCEDCNHYGKLSLDCARCDDDCSMYEPQESEVRDDTIYQGFTYGKHQTIWK